MQENVVRGFDIVKVFRSNLAELKQLNSYLSIFVNEFLAPDRIFSEFFEFSKWIELFKMVSNHRLGP